MAIVEMKDISFSYEEGIDVLKNISFSIEEGSYTTIIGHNGSGKSTIARLLAGLLEAKSGQIFVKDIEVNESSLSALHHELGIVFQNPDNQFIGASVADDIAFGLENQQIPHSEMQEVIETYANKVNMIDYLEFEPGNLSGGQKQRVAIAGCLAMRPSIVIFDEATSMLDPRGKKEIKELIRELHESSPVTIISITHDMEEVTSSDHVIVLDKGNILLEGDPDTIFKEEDKLKAVALDIPFAQKLRNEFIRKGYDLSASKDLKGVVDSIWELKSKD